MGIGVIAFPGDISVVSAFIRSSNVVSAFIRSSNVVNAFIRSSNHYIKERINAFTTD